MKLPKPNVDEFLKELERSDPESFAELNSAVEETVLLESSTEPQDAEEFLPESIVLSKGRPVLDIRGGETVIDIEELESQVWRSRLENAEEKLARHIPAVGRIELANHPSQIDWIGTGWLIQDNVVVTNRHVAEIFSTAQNAEFRFRPGLDGTSMKATIDFLEEFDNASEHEFPLFKVMHIEKGGGPDLAFLRIEPVQGLDLPKPVPIASASSNIGDRIAVIGYPARDDFFPNQKMMKRIFNDRYDKKRLSPGLITDANSTRIFHDCSTLGGVSGGEIVSLATGEAIALHFAGRMFSKNHSVPVDLVVDRLHKALRKGSSTKETQAIDLQASATGRRDIKATIPIHVNIELGDILIDGEPDASSNRPSSAGQVPIPIAHEDELDLSEARPEDYVDRDGYNPDFLGVDIPLPQLTRNNEDAFTFEIDGKTCDVLNYRHFSVLMSKSRRQCRYSACNISGLTSKRTKRKGWRFDPRIPKEFQIMKECYGNPPKFSRGHMTRREDPAWGDQDIAMEGNVDSMHVTNAVPQIQPFNGGIWLRLEDYALQNAREDDMRISVYTGPFFSDDENDEEESTRFGVQIPVKFWKVIAFLHEQTGALTATGYTMSQRSFIGDDEFVFGQHENHQRPIAEIEARAGISFGRLEAVDAMRDMPESVSGLLTDPRQIAWV